MVKFAYITIFCEGRCQRTAPSLQNGNIDKFSAICILAEYARSTNFRMGRCQRTAPSLQNGNIDKFSAECILAEYAHSTKFRMGGANADNAELKIRREI